MTLRRRRTFVSAVAALLGGIATAAIVLLVSPGSDTQCPVVQPVAPSAPSVITEDDPRWDCHTMGNLLCGNEVKA